MIPQCFCFFVGTASGVAIYWATRGIQLNALEIMFARRYGFSHCSGAAKQKSHQKTMIFDFETLLLGQNIDFRDN